MPSVRQAVPPNANNFVVETHRHGVSIYVVSPYKR